MRFRFGSEAMRSCTVCTGGSLIPATTSTSFDNFGTIFAPACQSVPPTSCGPRSSATHLMILMVRKASLGAALHLDRELARPFVQKATHCVRRERHSALPYTPWVFSSDTEGNESSEMQEWSPRRGHCGARSSPGPEDVHGCATRGAGEKSRSVPRKGSIRADRRGDAMEQRRNLARRL